jgi:hypothetical protein
MTNHPNFNVMSLGVHHNTCPKCGHWDILRQGFAYTRGTTDLNFCARIMKDKIFEKAGWPEYQKKKYPFLVDTNIFVQHVDQSGRNYPLGGVPKRYAPNGKSKEIK